MAAFAAVLTPLLWWLVLCTVGECTVLDPALYLLPSPPLNTNEDPGEKWSQPIRVTRDASNHLNEIETTTTEDPEPMESAETFWPSLRSNYGLGGVHIPLTFSISGSYGNGYRYGTGVVGSGYASGIIGTGVVGSYGSVSADDTAKTYGSYGKSALAGSSYGNYGSGYPGVRVYGSGGKTGWSGWGNGKWGHYGKG